MNPPRPRLSQAAEALKEFRCAPFRFAEAVPACTCRDAAAARDRQMKADDMA